MRKVSIVVLIVAAVWLFAGCVTPETAQRQEQRLSDLELEVRDLKDETRVRKMETERLLGQTRGSVPEMRMELDRLRDEVQRLTNDLELAEQRGGLPGSEPVKLKDQLDYISARLDRIEAKLRLPQLSLAVVDDPTAPDVPADQGPNITIQPDSPEPAAKADETDFKAAKNLFDQNGFDDSLAAFRQFVAAYPKSKFTPTAQFYVGECLYNQQKYEEAILEYQKVIKAYPKSSQVSSALLKQGFSFLSIGDKTSAKLLLQKVVRSYPKSRAATVAKEKLKTIN